MKIQKRKVNNRNVQWTQVYRRVHKKGTTTEVQKRKTRKVVKVQRDIVGASLEQIKQKRSQRPEIRAASREAALREIKERKKKQSEAAKKAKTATTPAKAAGAKKTAKPATGAKKTA